MCFVFDVFDSYWDFMVFFVVSWKGKKEVLPPPWEVEPPFWEVEPPPWKVVNYDKKNHKIGAPFWVPFKPNIFTFYRIFSLFPPFPGPMKRGRRIKNHTKIPKGPPKHKGE